MVGSEIHHQAFESRRTQFGGTDRPVAAVHLHRGRHRKAYTIEHGGDRATNRTQAGMSFADVMKKRSDKGVVVLGKAGFHPGGDVKGVALIGCALRPEQLGRRLIQSVVNSLLLVRTETRSGEMTKEPLDEVPGVSHLAPYDLFLQSTQRVEVGRNSIRSWPMSLPQTSQVP